MQAQLIPPSNQSNKRGSYDQTNSKSEFSARNSQTHTEARDRGSSFF